MNYRVINSFPILQDVSWSFGASLSRLSQPIPEAERLWARTTRHDAKGSLPKRCVDMFARSLKGLRSSCSTDSPVG